MPRAKRGNKRLERRKKILKLAKGYRGTKSKLYRSAKESVERGLSFAYTGRKLKKRDRKSTRLELQSRLHLVCRLLLEKKNKMRKFISVIIYKLIIVIKLVGIDGI